MWNPREPGGLAEGDGEGLGVGSVDGVPLSEPDGELLGSVTVVPNGVGEAPGVAVVPGAGVAVGGAPVGLGVGRGVAGGGGGGGVGAGVGVGTVTTTVGPAADGFVPPVLTEVNVTGQLPAARVLDPVHVPLRTSPLASESASELPGTDAVTLTASSDALPMKCTLNTNNVEVVPVSGVTVGGLSFASPGAALADGATPRITSSPRMDASPRRGPRRLIGPP
jgi:hypothetical protein